MNHGTAEILWLTVLVLTVPDISEIPWNIYSILYLILNYKTLFYLYYPREYETKIFSLFRWEMCKGSQFVVNEEI